MDRIELPTLSDVEDSLVTERDKTDLKKDGINIYKLFQPNGQFVNVYYNNGDNKIKILEDHFLPMWQDFCVDNWLNSNSNTYPTAEDRVKAYLDSCGWFLLRSDSKGLISEWDRVVDVARYIPMSSLGHEVQDYFYSAEQPPVPGAVNAAVDFVLSELDLRAEQHNRYAPRERPREMSRSEKITTVKDLYPGCTFHFCRVDTEGVFKYRGERYIVTDERYDAVQTKHGIYYALDTVVAVYTGNGTVYYTQSIDPIPIQGVKAYIT